MTVKNLKTFLILALLSTGMFRQALWADEMAGMNMGVSTAPTTIELTLPKAEEMALEGNPHILAADKRVDAASKQSLHTLAPADPMFMVDDSQPNMNMWLVQEDLGFPGQGLAQLDVNNAETGRQKAMASDTRRTILLQTQEAFWEFYYRQRVFDLLNDAQKEWKSLSQTLKSRELTGQWLSVKAVRAQMEIANATNDLFTSSQALEVSRANFNHLFSFPHETVYV
jgi:outer membrane protein TolC